MFPSCFLPPVPLHVIEWSAKVNQVVFLISITFSNNCHCTEVKDQHFTATHMTLHGLASIILSILALYHPLPPDKVFLEFLSPEMLFLEFLQWLMFFLFQFFYFTSSGNSSIIIISKEDLSFPVSPVDFSL